MEAQQLLEVVDAAAIVVYTQHLGGRVVGDLDAARAARGLVPSPLADPRVLARRVYFDLLGLPPEIEQLDDFEAEGDFDIVLLDICMPGMLGTDVAAAMRSALLRKGFIGGSFRGRWRTGRSGD